MSNIAALGQDPKTQKWCAVFQGRSIVSSQDKKYVIHVIRNGMNATARACGVTDVIELTGSNFEALLKNPMSHDNNDIFIPAETIRPQFSIDERFNFLADFADMAIQGTANAVLVSGRGGLGKTYTVKHQIKLAGFHYTHEFEAPLVPSKSKDDDDDGDDTISEDDDCEPEMIPDPMWTNPGEVHYVKGYSTASALYQTLFVNNGKLIVFDDCDSIQKDQNALNILKGALDSEEERWISWNTGRKPKGTPMTFNFTGRVVFITNIRIDHIADSLKTRCLKVDLTMTDDEKISRMRHIISQPDFSPEIDQEYKEDAVNFIQDHVAMSVDLSLRTLLDTIKLRAANRQNWERQALYSMTAGH